MLAVNRFTAAVEQLRATGVQLLDLTLSNPTRAELEYDKGAILGALASPRAMDYDPQAKGLLAARQAVARYYRDRADRGEGEVASHESKRVDPERVVLTTSTSEGYSFVFRLLCNAGDELLVPKPSYPLFEFLADLQDVRLTPYPLIYDHGWQIDFPSLEKAVTERTRGLVVVHPNNPTGSYVSAGEMEILKRFCREHGLAVIADEVFLDYALAGNDITSGKGHGGMDALVRPVERSSTPTASTVRPSPGYPSFVTNDEVLTFTLSGLSKVVALPQMKVAWVVTSGPEELVDAAMARLEVIADTYLSMNAPIQWAVPELLEQRETIQRQLLERVKTNLAELDWQLAVQKSCERLRVDGGWYAVLRVPVTRSDEELAIELVREKHVMVHPGHFYDFPGDGYLVLSLIAPAEEFKEGMSRVLAFLNS